MYAYFTVSDPSDELAQVETKARKKEFKRWLKMLPADDDIIEEVGPSLARSTGVSAYTSVNRMFALRRLLTLPQLLAVQKEFYHLDFQRLMAIDRALNKADMADEGVAEALDAEITSFLTPSKPRQHLPTAVAITKFIDEVITRLDETVASDEEMDAKPENYYSFFGSGKDQATCSATFDMATALVLDKAIRAAATEYDLSLPDALMKLVTGEVKPVVDLKINAYAGNEQASKVFVLGVGWIDRSTLNAKVSTRDMDKAATKVSTAYQTPEDIAAFVRGRDGQCRTPGCTTPADECQLDHRVNFADGGPTSAVNICLQCPPCHNVKTDKFRFYIMDPITGDMVWLYSDGTWEYDKPVGPLAPENAHWIQTIGDVAKNRADQTRAKAQAFKQDAESTPVDANEVVAGPEVEEEIPF